jgi:hypothetical protein
MNDKMVIQIGNKAIECTGFIGPVTDADVGFSSVGYNNIVTGFIGPVTNIQHFDNGTTFITIFESHTATIDTNKFPEWLKVGVRIEVDFILRKIILIEND